MNNPPPSDHCRDGDKCLQSTGYLEDVLSEYLICSRKRRRLLEFELDASSFLQEEWWTPSLSSNYPTEECCNDGTKNHDDVSSLDNQEDCVKRITPEEEQEEELGEDEEGISGTTTLHLQEDSSSSPQKDQEDHNNKPNLLCIHPIINSSASGVDKKTKKRASVKVAYPFAVVKPGGVEGDVTLNDINERILMPPTRPVRHPVGDYACRPMISPEGLGLSGKAVVAFTRIHTPGRKGTITIIRTRG